MSHELDKAMGKDLRVITERSGGAMGPGDSKVRQRNDPGQIAAEVAKV